MSRSGLAAAALATALLLSAPAFAVLPAEVLPDPEMEARARTISAELRCLVCQNQSIDISDADLAHDLRVLVRDRLKAGDSDSQVLDYIVSRYGEFVLLKPRFSLQNAMLWGTPVLLLLVGGVVIVALGRSRKARTEAGLSADENTALAEILRNRG